MEVETGAGLAAPAADAPGHGGGGFKDGAVDGEDLPMERAERIVGRARPRTRLEDLPSEMIEDRLQAGVVGELVEVGEGALAELGDREEFLRLPGLAEVLDG